MFFNALRANILLFIREGALSFLRFNEMYIIQTGTLLLILNAQIFLKNDLSLRVTLARSGVTVDYLNAS